MSGVKLTRAQVAALKDFSNNGAVENGMLLSLQVLGVVECRRSIEGVHWTITDLGRTALSEVDHG